MTVYVIQINIVIIAGSSDTIKPPKLVQKKPKNFRVVEDELTTISNAKVRVNPDGTVRLLKSGDTDMRYLQTIHHSCSECSS